MICPKCRFDQPDGSPECRRCGVIFEKYAAAAILLDADKGCDSLERRSPITESTDFGFWGNIRALLFNVEPQINPFYFWGRVAVFIGLFAWSWKFIWTPMESNYVGRSFMHLVNLPFHEAGHVIFSPLGRFITVLGGTLAQILMPLTCASVLLLKTRDPFGASAGLWWTAESFMDAAPYINDARSLQLMLIGGITGQEDPLFHDWHNILAYLRCLKYDHALAHIFYGTGIILMLAALLWGGYTLILQHRNIEKI